MVLLSSFAIFDSKLLSLTNNIAEREILSFLNY